MATNIRVNSDRYLVIVNTRAKLTPRTFVPTVRLDYPCRCELGFMLCNVPLCVLCLWCFSASEMTENVSRNASNSMYARTLCITVSCIPHRSLVAYFIGGLKYHEDPTTHIAAGTFIVD